MKVRIITSPTGLLNGDNWPEAGETIDLPKGVAEGMIEAGHVEAVTAKKPADKQADKPVETRPAPQADAETRTQKKS